MWRPPHATAYYKLAVCDVSHGRGGGSHTEASIPTYICTLGTGGCRSIMESIRSGQRVVQQPAYFQISSFAMKLSKQAIHVPLTIPVWQQYNGRTVIGGGPVFSSGAHLPKVWNLTSNGIRNTVTCTRHGEPQSVLAKVLGNARPSTYQFPGTASASQTPVSARMLKRGSAPAPPCGD